MSRILGALASFVRPKPAAPAVQPVDMQAVFYGQPLREAEPEKIRTGPMGIRVPWFLPYFDDVTGETATARLYYRKMLADPNVKAAVLGKLLAVAGTDLKLIPADKRNPRDKQAADGIKWMLSERIRGGFPGMVWDVLIGAAIDGHSICEKVYGVQRDGKYRALHVLRMLKPKQVGDDCVLETDEFRNVTGIRALRYNTGEVYDPRCFLIYRHLPLYDSPVGMSDFRAVYSRYWLLDTVLKLRAMGLEKRALPLLLGTYAGTSQKSSLEYALERAKSVNWISAPTGAKVEAIDIAGRGDDLFASAVRDLREEIFLGIQGALLQALTGGVGETRGSSIVHKDTAGLLKWFLSAMLAAAFNDYETGLIPDLCQRNWQVTEYPRAVLSSVDDTELAGSLAIDKGLSEMGLKLSQEDLYERYGRQPPLTADDALAPQQPQSPFGGSPFREGGAAPAVPFADLDSFCGGKGGKPGPCPEVGGDAAAKDPFAGRPKTTRDVDVPDPQGEDAFGVEVSTNPSGEGIKNWLKNNRFQPLKGMVVGDDLYFWGDVDVHHAPMAKAIGSDRPVPFENRFYVATDPFTKKITLDRHAAGNSKLTAWAKANGFDVLRKPGDEDLHADGSEANFKVHFVRVTRRGAEVPGTAPFPR